MAKDWVDYTAVKEAVSMEMALAHYQIELRKVNAFTLRGRCPLRTHVGESGNSFSINTAKGSGGAWSCLAASCMAQRDGRKGGNVLDFVAAMQECSVRDAALYLQKEFRIEASNERPSDYKSSQERRNDQELAAKGKSGGMVGQRQTRPNTEKKNEPLDFELQGIDPTHLYLKQRGISQETAEHFGCGFFPGKGSMSGRVVFPVHDICDGKVRLIGYAGRALDDVAADADGKYKTAFHKSLVVYNLNRVLELKTQTVIVTEGFFDTLKVCQAGFPNVVAVMGSELSDTQEKLLVDSFDRVVIIGDGDASGRHFIADATERLSRNLIVRPVALADGMQPDKMSSEEIQEMFKDVYN